MKRMMIGLILCAISLQASARPMAIFSRAQMKYGAQRDDFIHRWYERPLHQDTAFQAANDGHFLNPAAWLKTAEAVRLGKMNGFAACLTQARRDDIINRSVMPGGEMEVLVELPYQTGDDKAMELCFRTAELALKMPNVYKLDGRVVLTRYPACRERDLPFYAKVRNELKEKYGDRFAVMPYFSAWEKGTYDPDSSDAATLEAVKERLRRILRETDGFVLAVDAAYRNRRFDPDHFRRGEGAVVKSVLSEPEFAGKHLGVLTRGGHENCYRWQYTHDSQGTAMISGTLAAAAALGADFVFCPEWDEENENTHFRPTVCNGFSSARILRYFADTTAGRPLDVFPGDDPTIPNLILSYRKSLVAGEPIEAEVRNVPDATFSGVEFEVAFAWCDAEGRVLRKFAPQKLKAGELASVWFVAKASEFVTANRILRPFLAVRWSGGQYGARDGLWPLDLNPLRNIDHKWVKQPLREIMKDTEGTLQIGEPDATGMRIVKGRVKSASPIRSIEVIDDMDTVYVYAPETATTNAAERFRIQYKGLAANADLKMNGTIKVSGCHASAVTSLSDVDRGGRQHIDFADGVWTFRGTPFNNWGGTILFEVPRSGLATAKVEIDLKDTITGEVSLAELMDKGEHGWTASDCRGIVASHSPATEFLPKAFGGTEAEFVFPWKPYEKASVLRLRLIGMDYRRWVSKPESVYRPSGRLVKAHVYERDEQAVSEVAFDGMMFDAVAGDFSRRRGSVTLFGSGRALAGMEGASAALAQGYGQAESHNGNPIARYLKPGMAPATGWWVLPQQLAPCFAGFRLEMEVRPKEIGKRQGLYGSGNCGFTLQIEPDGSLLALPAQGNGFLLRKTSVQARLKGPKVAVGEWNTIVFVTDRRTMWFEVNGVKGEEKPYSDYFWNQRYGLLGAIHPTLDFFDGEIRAFKVSPL